MEDTTSYRKAYQNYWTQSLWCINTNRLEVPCLQLLARMEDDPSVLWMAQSDSTQMQMVFSNQGGNKCST